MRTLFVTAADESYVPLLRGLVLSLQQWQPSPYTAFAFFDLGLSAQSRNWIGRYAAHVVEPGWDLPVSDHTRTHESHARALTVRPFLPDYFPGYDIYQWIDPDCWVQERYALDWYGIAAARGALAITPQVHHAYRHSQASFAWRAQRMHAYFGPQAVQRLSWASYVNAGVFALPADAPHWNAWRREFAAGLKATEGRLCCDQTALNHVLWADNLPVATLPALCNWLCHLAVPHYDAVRQRFCEPATPGQALGILHLAAGTKNLRIKAKDSNVEREVDLRFPAPQRQFQAP